METAVEGHLAEGARAISPALMSTASSLDSLFPSRSSEYHGGSVASDEDIGSKTENFTRKPNFVTAEQHALANLCINTIRFLCVDAINNANSGHPGICMGMAASAFVLFDKHLKFNPLNPKWPNRDRFVLSAGHGSMLLYSMLHLYGYESMTLADIKNFRQLHSKTPGHPECTETPGVEVCTGPLGQGISNAVGIAIAEAHLASVYNRPGGRIVNQYTFCMVGDGCMMEGISGEACSLAGHLKLGKLIVLYDDNNISIDGSTELAFTEDTSRRFEAYGWQVLHVANGNDDIASIDLAIQKAKDYTQKPTLIKVSTTIGFGAPNKSGLASVHGSALGKAETLAAREALNFEYEPFDIPSPAMEHFRRKGTAGRRAEDAWNKAMSEYKTLYPELSRHFTELVVHGQIPHAVEETLRKVAAENAHKSMATRKHSQAVLNTIAPLFPNFLGGAADTSPSTLTDLSCSKDFTFSHRVGRNIRFGVREHAMAAIANGISSAGYNLRPYCSTFLVFTDYMRAAMRMASLSKVGTIFVTTHDSIGLGEDGPSHQPIEHLASLRAMPNHDTWRPADSMETAAAYSRALATQTRPSTLVLSRQTTSALRCTDYDGARRGGYVMDWSNGRRGDVCGVIVATGSEVCLAVEAAARLYEENGMFAQVVSLPCWSEFERQDKLYRRSVCCLGRERTLSVEAGSAFGWSRYADHHVSVDDFGLSGPGKEVLAAFGITADGIICNFLKMMGVDT